MEDFLQEFSSIDSAELANDLLEAYESLKYNYNIEQLVRDQVDATSKNVTIKKSIIAGLLATFTGATIMIPGSTIGIIALATLLSGGKKTNNFRIYNKTDVEKYNYLMELVQKDLNISNIINNIKSELEKRKPNKKELESLSKEFKRAVLVINKEGKKEDKNILESKVGRNMDKSEYNKIKIIKDYSEGKWKKIFSAIADMGVAATSTTLGLAVFGLSVWGGPVGIGAVLAGLGAFLMVGTPGLVLKIIFKLGDDYLRVNPKVKKLAELAQKDSKAMSITKEIEKELDTGKASKSELRQLKNKFASRLKELEKEQNMSESAFEENESNFSLLENLENINESVLLTEAFKLNFKEAKKEQFERFMYVKDKVNNDTKYKYIKLAAGTFSSEKLRKFISKISQALKKNSEDLNRLNDYQKLDFLILLLDKAGSNNQLSELEQKTKRIYHKYLNHLNLDKEETKVRIYSEKLSVGEAVLAFLIFSAIIVLIPGIHFELGSFLVLSQAVLAFLTNVPSLVKFIIEKFTRKDNPEKEYYIDSETFNKKLERLKERLNESIINFDKDFLLENLFNKEPMTEKEVKEEQEHKENKQAAIKKEKAKEARKIKIAKSKPVKGQTTIDEFL
jgi:hypothetical protein